MFKSQICQPFNTKNKIWKHSREEWRISVLIAWGRQVSRNCPYPAGEMKKKMPRVWASGSFNWNLTQFPASYGGKKSTDTRWSNNFSYRLSCWVKLPVSILLAKEASTLLASLAKSKSLTSAGGTGTIAKASLSSLILAVPIWKYIDGKRGLVLFIDKKRGKVKSPYFASVAQKSHLPYKPEAKQTLGVHYVKNVKREEKGV